LCACLFDWIPICGKNAPRTRLRCCPDFLSRGWNKLPPTHVASNVDDGHRGLLTLNGQRVACIDATQIAVDCFGMQKPNTPMLGAIARTTNLISLDTLLAEVEETFSKKFPPELVKGNLQAIRRAYEEVSNG